LIIPFAVSILFLFITVVLNTVLLVVASFVHIQFHWFTTVATIVNLLLFAGFSIYALYSLSYIGNLHEKDMSVREKISRHTEISAMLGLTMAMTDNQDVKAALHKLKESVDYSTNISTSITRGVEDTFDRMLTEIQNDIQSETPTKEIIDKINNASRLWRSRNTSMN